MNTHQHVFDLAASRDYSPLATRLASVYDCGPYMRPDARARDALIETTETLFKRIAHPVYIVAYERYVSLAEMRHALRNEQMFFVRNRERADGKAHPWLAHSMTKFRAVHDYFTHLPILAPFTLQGELDAYAQHVKLYPPETHAYIWSTIVLENAYRVNRGRWRWPMRVAVFDADRPT